MRWRFTLPLIVLVGFLGVWAVRGAHTGWWTHDTEFRTTPDPFTGLVKMEPVERWTPGLDFLSTGLVSAAALYMILALLAWIRIRKEET